MANVFLMEFGGMEAVSAAHHSAGVTYSAAASADGEAHIAAAAAALGPIGANYLAAFAPALQNNLAATRELARVHHALGDATAAAKATAIASDDA